MVRTRALKNYSDIHYTQQRVAELIVRHFDPTGVCLEPFAGGGAFLDVLPEPKRWCEIQQGRCFFQHMQKVDWIITNPPFSNLTDVFAHAFTLANHCVFLIPVSKYFSSAPRLALAREYGGLEEMLMLGTGRSIGFDIGFPFAAMKFTRGYAGDIRISYPEESAKISSG